MHRGFRDGVSDAHLGGNVDDDARPVLLEQIPHAFPLREVEVGECETRTGRELGEAIFLHLDIIIIVQVVKTDDFFAFLKRPLRQVVANESHGAGDKDFQLLYKRENM